MGTEIKSAYKLLEEIGKLNQTIADLRYFSYLNHLATITYRKRSIIEYSLKRLSLLDTFKKLCYTGTADHVWNEEGILCKKHPQLNGYIIPAFDDHEKFYSFLQNLKLTTNA